MTEPVQIQRAIAPGKRTLVEACTGMPESATASPPEAAPDVPRAGASRAPRATLASLFGGYGAPQVQRRVLGTERSDGEPTAVHDAAARGTATAASPLPHGDSIQRVFGRHDISSIQAHVGPDAAAAARDMGAVAYAAGHHVVFDGAPDLHTAAHEAAHVVQQRAGVHLEGGVGEAGDPHERHADAVADRVVRGESAESLLDGYASTASSAPAAVQRMVVPMSAFKANPITEEVFAVLKSALAASPSAVKVWNWFDRSDSCHLFFDLTSQGAQGRYAGTQLLFKVGDTWKDIEGVSAEDIEGASSISVKIAVNLDKLGQTNINNKTIGVNETLATLIHEFTAHAERMWLFIEAVRSKQMSGAKFLDHSTRRDSMMNDVVHHVELVKQGNESYNQVSQRARTVIGERQQTDTRWNLGAFDLELIQDRYTQAGVVYMNPLVRTAHDKIDAVYALIKSKREGGDVQIQAIEAAWTQAMAATSTYRNEIVRIMRVYPEFPNHPQIQNQLVERLEEVDEMYDDLAKALDAIGKLR